MKEKRTQVENESGSLGTVKIADEVVQKCAAAATLRTEGVAGLSGKKAVKMSSDEDEITLDILVVVEYAQHIPDVAFKIQKNVKTDVEKLTGSAVKAVNIHVQGIHFPEGEEENDQN